MVLSCEIDVNRLLQALGGRRVMQRGRVLAVSGPEPWTMPRAWWPCSKPRGAWPGIAGFCAAPSSSGSLGSRSPGWWAYAFRHQDFLADAVLMINNDVGGRPKSLSVAGFEELKPVLDPGGDGRDVRPVRRHGPPRPAGHVAARPRPAALLLVRVRLHSSQKAEAFSAPAPGTGC